MTPEGNAELHAKVLDTYDTIHTFLVDYRTTPFVGAHLIQAMEALDTAARDLGVTP